MTEPSWPAVLAPIACMRTWLVKSSSCATRCTSRPLMGKALMPAAPTRGLTLPRVTAQRTLPNRIPAMVSSANAKRPRPRMNRVVDCRNVSACIRLPTVRPRKIVDRLASSLDAVLASWATTPDSFRRFPNISVATSGAEGGTRMPTRIVTTMGKAMTAPRGTGRGAYSMRMRRSAFVVKSRISGGWMIGTRLM